MKYLKKFNEELKSSTYRRAASKLLKMGHKERSEELKDWGKNVEKMESIKKWQDNVKEFSKYGEFKIRINDKSGKEIITDNFYLDILFEGDMFIDSFPDINSFPFFIGLIPVNEESISKIDKLFPNSDFDNGFYWTFYMSINYVIDDDTLKIKGIDLGPYDQGMIGYPVLADRGSAGRFKNLIKKIFDDEKFNYPSGRNDTPYLYRALEMTLCAESGYSSDYGFSLDNVADFITNLSANELFKR